jgi:hypothetical protein
MMQRCGRAIREEKGMISPQAATASPMAMLQLSTPPPLVIGTGGRERG